MMQGEFKSKKLKLGKGKKFLIILVIVVLSLGAYVSAALPAQVPAVNDPLVSRAPKTLDGQFLDVSAKAPGFGGMFIDGDVLNVYLVDPAQRPAAEATIAAVFGRERIPAGGIKALSGQYSFAQLNEWHNKMGSLFDISGVVLTDVDERTNRLKVGVDSASVIGPVEKELASLGIPRGAVNILVTDPIVPVTTLRDRIRPIEGGIQFQFISYPYLYTCTLSFPGVRAGVSGFVTASHCTANQGGVDNTQDYQPDTSSGNLIGTEIADPLYTKANCPPGVKGKICRWSDSAFSQLASGVTESLGVIANTNSVNTGSLTIDPTSGTWTITSEGASLVGQTVNKVGRTTGWTQGLVTATCADTGVSGTRILQRCQDFVSAQVAGGDSGSPVFAITSGTNVELRGLLWGSSGGTTFVYSPIANIQRINELGPITKCASGSC